MKQLDEGLLEEYGFEQDHFIINDRIFEAYIINDLMVYRYQENWYYQISVLADEHLKQNPISTLEDLKVAFLNATGIALS